MLGKSEIDKQLLEGDTDIDELHKWFTCMLKKAESELKSRFLLKAWFPEIFIAIAHWSNHIKLKKHILKHGTLDYATEGIINRILSIYRKRKLMVIIMIPLFLYTLYKSIVKGKST